MPDIRHLIKWNCITGDEEWVGTDLEFDIPNSERDWRITGMVRILKILQSCKS